MKIAIRHQVRWLASSSIEIVERKGLGHPDTLADTLAETISNSYSMECLERFGAVLHHNVDKLAVLGGNFTSGFGVAQKVSPIRVLLAGRMSFSFAGTPIDVFGLQENVSRRVLAERIPRLKPDEDLEFLRQTTDYSRIPRWFAPHSFEDLPELKVPRASDTSVVCGFWPHTPTERLVLALEGYFYDSASGAGGFRDIGSDIKILAIRTGRSVEVVLAVPMISLFVHTQSQYEEQVNELERSLTEYANERFSDHFLITISVNTQSGFEHQERKLYLLAIGSCVECGEEGVVGRGNGVSGVISFGRPHIMEAPFGKNPVYHSGKVFAHLATLLAQDVSDEISAPVTITLAVRNGDRIKDPSHIFVDVHAANVTGARAVSDVIERTLDTHDYLTAIVKGQSFLRFARPDGLFAV